MKKAGQSMETAPLKVANSMLSAAEKMYPGLNFHKDFSMKMAIQQLKRMFISDGLQGMLE